MTEIITRKEAKARGLKRYFTGKPCPSWHFSERFVFNCTCVACRQNLYMHRFNGGTSVRLSNVIARSLVSVFSQTNKIKPENETISRKEAIAVGVSRYFTGEPCKHGHVCARYVNDFKCVECARIKTSHQQRIRSRTDAQRRYSQSEKARAACRKYKNKKMEKYRLALEITKQLGIQL